MSRVQGASVLGVKYVGCKGYKVQSVKGDEVQG